jgi:cation-transporting P-type ATPase E
VTSVEPRPSVSEILEHDTVTGLSTEQVATRVRNNDVNDVPATPTRTLGQILRANLLTPFNALLGGLLAVILVVGPIQDALFGLVLVGNSLVGILQELRAKRALDQLALLRLPRQTSCGTGRWRNTPSRRSCWMTF